MVDVTEPMYLIRKGGYYYRPNSQGYTVSKDEAGRYTLKEAINITHPNGPDGPRDGMSYELSAAKEGYDSSECATHGESDNLMGMCCMNTKTAQSAELEALRGEVEQAKDILSGLSSYLGAGLGDDATTLKQFDERIRWGIDHIGSVYRNRAAQVVEECSKRPQTTWGEVKRAIMDDTTLPTAASTDHEATIAQLRDRVAGLEEGLGEVMPYGMYIPSHVENKIRALLTQNEVG